MRPSQIRWILLIPVLMLSQFFAYWAFQFLFPLFQSWEGMSKEELYGMSIMDQEAVFLPYGEAIAAFFLVTAIYATAPRGKILISVSLLLLAAPFAYLGVENLTEGVVLGAISGFLLAAVVHRVSGQLKKPTTPLAA